MSGAGPVQRLELEMPWPGVQSQHFRQIMMKFPSAVSVVTALDGQRLPRGLTCSAFTSLSMEPPALLACVNRRNGSLAAIRDSGGFALNLLRAGRGRVSEIFASGESDKFASLAWQPSPRLGLPWLVDDALAFVECQVVADVSAGTHAILIGLVTSGACADEVEDGPLVYWHHRYGRWQDTVPAQSTPRT